MKTFVNEAGITVLAVVAVTALVLGLALASGACW